MSWKKKSSDQTLSNDMRPKRKMHQKQKQSELVDAETQTEFIFSKYRPAKKVSEGISENYESFVDLMHNGQFVNVEARKRYPKANVKSTNNRKAEVDEEVMRCEVPNLPDKEPFVLLTSTRISDFLPQQSSLEVAENLVENLVENTENATPPKVPKIVVHQNHIVQEPQPVLKPLLQPEVEAYKVVNSKENDGKDGTKMAEEVLNVEQVCNEKIFKEAKRIKIVAHTVNIHNHYYKSA